MRWQIANNQGNFMAFILKKEPTFSANIQLNDGIEFSVVFKAVQPAELGKNLPTTDNDLIRNTLIANEIMGLVVGWDGVHDEQGNPVEFSEASLKAALQLPGLALKLVEAYSIAYGVS